MLVQFLLKHQNPTDKDVLLRGIAGALTGSKIDDETRGNLVEILSKQSGTISLSKAQMAEATLSSLRIMWDAKSPQDQTKSAMESHIEALKQLQYRPASALILEIARDAQAGNTATKAQEFLDDLVNGTEPIWNSAVSDKLADAEARARSLEENLKNTKDREEIVKLIAVSTKDFPMQGTSDPRLQLITERMTDSDEFIRIAAGRAILESKNDALPEYELAKKRLASLAVSAGNASLKKEALKALAQIKTKP